jgi:phosphatidylethanolamine-binding protein (PEBP) family uncharacterized protein
MVRFALRCDDSLLLSARRCAVALFLLGLGAQAGCHGSSVPGQGTPALGLTSSNIHAGEIPKKCTCDSEDGSPELAWTGAPAGTQSLALIMIDLDAPMGEFVHWLIYDVPAAARELPEALSPQEQLPDGSRQAATTSAESGMEVPARRAVRRTATCSTSTLSTRS